MNRELGDRRFLAQSPPRIMPPAGDLALCDGRTLVYVGLSKPQQAPSGGELVRMRAWRGDDGMIVLASLDPTHHGLLLHVSVSYVDRDPTWADIKAVRYAFYPAGMDVAMILPQDADYVNLHPHCFHLWQTPVTWGIQ